MKERRESSIEQALILLGEIKSLGEANNTSLKALNEKVALQNGRIGKLENRNSFYSGSLIIISAFMVPILFIIISEIVTRIKF